MSRTSIIRWSIIFVIIALSAYCNHTDAALCCQPDPGRSWAPVATWEWNSGDLTDIDGSYFYVGIGGEWSFVEDLPCYLQIFEDPEQPELYREEWQCPGITVPVPVARLLYSRSRECTEVCVTVTVYANDEEGAPMESDWAQLPDFVCFTWTPYCENGQFPECAGVNQCG